MKLNAATESCTYAYDALNRLTTASLSGAGAANYNYAYSYNELGNIMSRSGTDPDMTYSYTDPAHKQAVLTKQKPQCVRGSKVGVKSKEDLPTNKGGAQPCLGSIQHGPKENVGKQVWKLSLQ